MKTFNTTAETKKGAFNVTIEVWEEEIGNWKSNSFVVIDGSKLKVSFSQYNSSSVSSFEVAKKYNINSEVKLKCDCSEVVKYISNIQMQRIKDSAKEIEHLHIQEENHNL